MKGSVADFATEPFPIQELLLRQSIRTTSSSLVDACCLERNPSAPRSSVRAPKLRDLDANRRRVGEFMQKELPGISFISPEATYFAWLDCSALNLRVPAAKFFLDKAKVALSPGGDFSSYTNNFARLNFATSPEILEEILSRMVRAVKG